MSEDCQNCGTSMYCLDEDNLCPACTNYEYNWEEAEYFDNQAFYEYEGKIQLDKLEELPYKEKIK